jgi:hypothetical protein
LGRNSEKTEIPAVQASAIAFVGEGELRGSWLDEVGHAFAFACPYKPFLAL